MNVANSPNVQVIRDAILSALPSETSHHGSALSSVGKLYIPQAHFKALRPESYLVIGSRGSGKSVWAACLADERFRNVMATVIPELANTEVQFGFSQKHGQNMHPDSDTFNQVRKNGKTPFSLWKAIVARAILDEHRIPRSDLAKTVEWVDANPELLGRYMKEVDDRLTKENKRKLLLFDALDLLGNDWSTMDDIVRDLLRTALWLKSWNNFSAKIFLREDQYGRTVTNFPDASKLVAMKAELIWARHDLHGLLWQLLVNAEGDAGETLRSVFADYSRDLEKIPDSYWRLPDEAKRESPLQTALFECLAGQWMGRDKKRGVPYTWAVGHLSDSKGRTSPRSFIAAIREAAEDSQTTYPDHDRPLHYESIKKGIQKASEIRVAEMAEDYDWIQGYMEPLKGLNVPCDIADIQERWERILSNGPNRRGKAPPPAEGGNRLHLPPQHENEGWIGIQKDLERIGIFEERSDGRINMPDLYRVGFRLGRKGGVKRR